MGEKPWSRKEIAKWLKNMRWAGHKVYKLKCSDPNCPIHGTEKPVPVGGFIAYECGGYHVVLGGVAHNLVGRIEL